MLQYKIRLVSEDNQTLTLSTDAVNDEQARQYATTWLENNPEYSIHNYTVTELQAKYPFEDSGLENML